MLGDQDMLFCFSNSFYDQQKVPFYLLQLLFQPSYNKINLTIACRAQRVALSNYLDVSAKKYIVTKMNTQL